MSGIDYILDKVAAEHRRSRELLLAHPEWSDRKIASYVWKRSRGSMDHWIAAARNLHDGVVPPLVTHAEIVRWCHEVGTLCGLWVNTEYACRLSSRRRIVPDVVLRPGYSAPASMVIEVKRAVDTRSALTKVIDQITFYLQYFLAQPDHDDVQGVVLANSFDAPNCAAILASHGLGMWTPVDYFAHVTQNIDSLAVSA